MGRPRFIFALVLFGAAAKLIQIGFTRDGVGPFEYVTLVALVALALLTALRLGASSERLIPRSSAQASDLLGCV